MPQEIGLILWAKFVVPTLLPFFVATDLLLHTNILSIIGKILNPIMKIFFKVPGISAFAFLMGSISGYPVGAKIVTTLRNNGAISKNEGDRLLAFTNNSGPMFIVATVGIGLFGSSSTGFLLLAIHLLSAVSVAILIGFFSKNNTTNLINQTDFSLDKNYISLNSLGEILSKAILNSINTLFLIGGFVVLFSVIISILLNSGILSLFIMLLTPIFRFFNFDTNFIKSVLIGFLEVTNGVNMISNIHIKNISTNIMFTSFILGFGGLSVALQILSVISKSDLSIKPYLIGKLMQATFSVFYTYVALCYFKFLNTDLTNTLSFSIIPLILFSITIAFLCRSFYKLLK